MIHPLLAATQFRCRLLIASSLHHNLAVITRATCHRPLPPPISSLRRGSTLSPFLLPTNDLKSWRVFLDRTRTSPSLLSNLIPASASIFALIGVTGEEIRSGRIRDDTAVGQLAATDELFGEAAAVDGTGGSVDGVGYNFRFGWEVKERSNESVN